METIDMRTADEVKVVVKTCGRFFEGTLPEIVADLRWEVREEIAEAMLRGRQSGEFSLGGQAYKWYVQD